MISITNTNEFCSILVRRLLVTSALNSSARYTNYSKPETRCSWNNGLTPNRLVVTTEFGRCYQGIFSLRSDGWMEGPFCQTDASMGTETDLTYTDSPSENPGSRRSLSTDAGHRSCSPPLTGLTGSALFRAPRPARSVGHRCTLPAIPGCLSPIDNVIETWRRFADGSVRGGSQFASAMQ